MNLVEAYECGKMVRHPSALRTAIKAGRSLRWLDDKGCADTYVTVDNVLLHDWELVPEPPKRYTFEEALPMMRQGKMMRPVLQGTACNKYYRRLPNASVYMEMDAKDGSEVGGADILLSYCDAMWEERP